MSFEFDRAEAIVDNVARLARKRLDRVLAAVADSPDERAVHASRRNLKKLRAMLRLVRAGLGEETFARENTCYRDAARALSAARDARVLVQAFDRLRLELDPGEMPGPLDQFRAELVAGFQASEQALRAGADGELATVVAALIAARTRIDHWTWTGPANGWRVLGKGLGKTYRQALGAMRRAGDTPAEADFHEWRKQVKHLAYQLRLLRPVHRRKLGALCKALDALGQTLGDEHDLAVLAVRAAERFLAVPREEGAGMASLIRHIEAHRLRLRHAALEQGTQAFRQPEEPFVEWLRRGWKRWRKR